MQPTAPWHILLIEDDADDCADMRQMLLRGGSRRYRFSEAQSGAEGIRKVLTLEDGPVDCVLLDYGLPDMDALEVLAALRQGAELPACPVVVITGAAVEEGQALLSAGAQDFIGKRWTSADSLTRAVENAIDRYALMVERVRAEMALRDSEVRYRALFNSIDAGYAVVQMIFDENDAALDALYLQVNPAFEQQTGLSNAAGQTLRALVPGIENIWLETYGTVALTGVPMRLESYVEPLQRWFDSYAFRLGDPQARQVAVLFTDTTERKRMAAVLVDARAAADAGNQAKSDFLLHMSHELRSPLSAMLGFAQLLEAGKPPLIPAQRDSVEKILRSGWYLAGLINEILDLTAIESGKLLVALQPMSLANVLDDCQAMLTPKARSSGIAIHFSRIEPSCLLQADPIRTKQVLINLLTNAIKYNRPGGQVEVHCSAVAPQWVRISVKDTGPGLTAAQMAQLFQPFSRLGREVGAVGPVGAGGTGGTAATGGTGGTAETTGTAGAPWNADNEGTGIGLVISKRLVELMGGRIGVDSVAGQGSCFWFELAAADTPSVPVRPMPLRTVLYIEANAALQHQAAELLALHADLCLLRAGDIGRGTEIALSTRPDVILLGIHQLNTSDREAIRQLTMTPATAGIPVIALMAQGVSVEAGAAAAAGFHCTLTLPLASEAFAHALAQAFELTRAAGRNAAQMEHT